jgi:hypothetical protein
VSSGGVTVVRTEQSVEIVADLDRRRLEMLTLELRRFARRHGLELRVERGRTEALGKVIRDPSRA